MRYEAKELGNSRVVRHNAGHAGEPQVSREAPDNEPVNDKPRSVYELITRQMLEEVRRDIAEIKGRVNTVLWLMVGAILVELLVKVVR